MECAQSTSNGTMYDLTPMQRKVVRLASLGCSVREIAVILRISVSTADNHKTRAMARLGVHDMANLTRYAILKGISPLDDELAREERNRIGTKCGEDNE